MNKNDLTRREREVLHLLAAGLSDKLIAKELIVGARGWQPCRNHCGVLHRTGDGMGGIISSGELYHAFAEHGHHEPDYGRQEHGGCMPVHLVLPARRPIGGQR